MLAVVIARMLMLSNLNSCQLSRLFLEHKGCPAIIVIIVICMERTLNLFRWSKLNRFCQDTHRSSNYMSRTVIRWVQLPNSSNNNNNRLQSRCRITITSCQMEQQQGHRIIITILVMQLTAQLLIHWAPVAVSQTWTIHYTTQTVVIITVTQLRCYCNSSSNSRRSNRISWAYRHHMHSNNNNNNSCNNLLLGWGCAQKREKEHTKIMKVCSLSSPKQ